MENISKLLKELNIINAEDPDKNDNAILDEIMNGEIFTQEKIIDILEIVLDRDVNADIKTKEHKKVLQLAIKNRMKDVIDFLLTRRTDIDSAVPFFIEDEYIKFQKLSTQKKNCNVSDSELERIETKSANFVEWLISKGFDFHSKNKENQSALLMTIELDLQHILPVLLKYTKDINFVDERNRTLLHLFLEKTDDYCGIDKNFYSTRYKFNIIQILLDKGLSVDAEDNFKCTPIRIAIAKTEDLDIVEALLESSKNLSHENSEGETLLHMVIRKWATTGDVNTEYYMKISRILIAKGADVNEPDKNGMRPAFYAIHAHNLGLVEFLRKNGANFSVTTVDGQSLMHLLVNSRYYMMNGNETEMKLFELLIEDEINVNAKNSNGETLFHTVIRRWTWSNDFEYDYYIKYAKLLIAKGADVNEPDNNGKIPLCYPIESDNQYIIDFLCENGSDTSIIAKYPGSLMSLLVNKDQYGNDDDVQIELFKELMRNGANVNCRNNQMETPLLYLAVHNPIAKLTGFLVELGADVNAKNLKGNTALHALAIRRRNPQNICMLNSLLKYGADFNALNQAGYSVLRLALWRDNNQGKIKMNRVKPNNTPCLVDDCIEYNSSKEVIILLRHWVKLKVANLKCDIDYEYMDLIQMTTYKRYQDICLKEIEKLKSTFIDKRTSLYNLLHINPSSRCAYIHNEKLQELINSPMLDKQFPEYAVLILASYHEAVTRRTILEPARNIWLEMTGICLPDICVDDIYSFLKNSDLFNIIEYFDVDNAETSVLN